MARPRNGRKLPRIEGENGREIPLTGENRVKRSSKPAAASAVSSRGGGRGRAQREGSGPAGPAVEVVGKVPTGGAGGVPPAAPPVGGRPEAAHLSLINRAKVCDELEVLDGRTVAERVAKFGVLKGYSLEIAKFEMDSKGVSIDDSLARKWGQDNCGDWLTFRKWSTGGEESRVVAGNFCGRHLTCPLCANRRGARLLQDVVPKLLQVRAENPAARMHLVTLTLRNGEDLVERLRCLQKGVQLLQGRRRSARRDGTGRVMSRVLGGIGQVEIKRGANSGAWHPHYHGVWVNDGRMDYRALRDAWRDVMGGEAFIANVRQFECERLVDPSPELFRDQLTKDCMEVCKYCVKFDTSRDSADVWDIATKVQGKRLRSSFGELRGLDVDEGLLDQELNWDELDWWEEYYRWSRRQSQYTQDFSRIAHRSRTTGVTYRRHWLAGEKVEQMHVRGEDGEMIPVNWEYVENVLNDLEEVPF